MKKIITVTFHRAHNHGSALQAYALQEFVIALGKSKGVRINYHILDYGTPVQQKLYGIFKDWNNAKDIVKNIVSAIYFKQLHARFQKFVSFQSSMLKTVEPTMKDGKIDFHIMDADCFISGSDQLWNVRASDFSDFYYLDSAPIQTRKISYAASFGPLKIDWSKYDAEKYTALLNNYQYISVRERGSAHNVEHLTSRSCEIHVDPTLLLDVEDWRKIQSDANYCNGQYILLYCLEPSKAQLKMAKAISKKLKLPIVALRYNNKNDIVNNFVKRYDAGPQDFLAYIDHAALVITSSFHGTAFSIIYRKPFYVLNGMSDNRISNILSQTGLEHHAIDESFNPEEAKIVTPDIESINQYLATERERSRNYLKKALLL